MHKNMAKLSEIEIQEQLHDLPGWSYEGGSLTRDYVFPDFAVAFAFVTRLALWAEKANHHPDLDIRYNKVRIGLISHDAGGITARDIAMAQKISTL